MAKDRSTYAHIPARRLINPPAHIPARLLIIIPYIRKAFEICFHGRIIQEQQTSHLDSLIGAGVSSSTLSFPRVPLLEERLKCVPQYQITRLPDCWSTDRDLATDASNRLPDCQIARLLEYLPLRELPSSNYLLLQSQ